MNSVIFIVSLLKLSVIFFPSSELTVNEDSQQSVKVAITVEFLSCSTELKSKFYLNQSPIKRVKEKENSVATLARYLK